MSVPWVTFDCYGTLVDWQAGFRRLLEPWSGGRVTQVLQAYHHHEPEVQALRPFRSYRQVLVESLRRAAREAGIALPESHAGCLPDQWSQLLPFDDVEPALARLRAAGCRLAVLTNCDEDLFAQTHRAFRQPFDLVLTAERVRDYKPSRRHFECFAQAAPANPSHWVHVANSPFHDLAPARDFGLRTVWLDREGNAGQPVDATAHVRTASDLPGAVARLLGLPVPN